MKTEPIPVDVLAVGAHPDDIELSMAGTLLKLGALGYRIGLVDLTRGELGSRGTPADRRAEALEAAHRLAAAFRANLDLPDGAVSATEDARRAMVRVIRRSRPKIVFTHHPTEEHPDHVHGSRIVAEACHHARLVNYDREPGLERHRPNALIHFAVTLNVLPTFFVDISEHFDAKYHVITAHASQFHRPGSREPETYLSKGDFLKQRRATDIHRGSLIGVSAAEGFVVSQPLAVADPVAFF
jgi:N-acetylglucosamine malate deacetylase 1